MHKPYYLPHTPLMVGWAAGQCRNKPAEGEPYGGEGLRVRNRCEETKQQSLDPPYITCPSVQVHHFDRYWSNGKVRGFEVYIVELMESIDVCVERNVHQRTREEIEKVRGMHVEGFNWNIFAFMGVVLILGPWGACV